MSQNRRNSVLAVGVLALLLAAAAPAQDLERAQVFAPADLSMYGSGPQPKQGYFFGFDGLWWSVSAPEVALIGRPGTREAMYAPEAVGLIYPPGTPFPVPNIIPAVTELQSSSTDTGDLKGDFAGGNRIEFGRVYGRAGWLFSSYRLNNQVQSIFNMGVDVVFDDPGDRLDGYLSAMLGYLDDAAYYSTPFQRGPLPITFDGMLAENRVDTWGMELMGLFRSRQTQRGGFFEFLGGVRYLEFDDSFHVSLYGNDVTNADGEAIAGVANYRFSYDQGPDNDPTATNWSPIGPGVVLADSNWTTTAENHIVGPQIGGRWFKQSGRWTLSAEGRFLAGLNMQNIRQTGILGSELDQPPPFAFAIPTVDIDGVTYILLPDSAGYPYVPLLREPYQFDHSLHKREWSPGGELRLELMCELTRAISVKVGWTGLVLGGIARATAMPDYSISDPSTMGIRPGVNRQTVFLNGLNVGVTVNR